MRWYKDRVWQMGLGALVVLLGTTTIYLSAANEPVRSGLMWLGLGVLLIGLLVPLIIQLVGTGQKKEEKTEEA